MTYTNKGIVTIPNFVSDDVVTSIRPELETYRWWTYANIPHRNQWKVNYEPFLSHTFLASLVRSPSLGRFACVPSRLRVAVGINILRAPT